MLLLYTIQNIDSFFSLSSFNILGLKNEDEVGREAFKVAFRRMQYKYGSWFTIRGSEEQVIIHCGQI